jgi:hypothetical protein
MNENQNNALHFVYSVKRNGDRCEASAATFILAPGLPYYPWNAWAMCTDPFEVRCGYVEFQLKSRVEYPSRMKRMRDMLQRALDIRIDCSVEAIPAPFFLSGNLDRKPSNYKVVVHLLFDTVDFLPQVEASMANGRDERKKIWEMNVREAAARKGWLRKFAEKYLNLKPRQERPWWLDEGDFEGSTRSQEPFPGLYLPVSLVGMEVPSVLLLQGSLGSRVYSATLYASDTLPMCQAPIALACTGTWTDADEPRDLVKVVGRIVQMQKCGG